MNTRAKRTGGVAHRIIGDGVRRARRGAIAILLLATFFPGMYATAQDPAGTATMRISVRAVSIYDVPGPPTGDYWDPILSSVLGLFAGRAGIYPDVMICARPAQPGFTGRPACTQVCTDLQGTTTTGEQDKPACERPLRLDLPAGDPRMLVEVLEMDEAGGQQQVHAIIARNVLVADPTRCPVAQPCRFEVAPGKTPLVLAFSNLTVGTVGTPSSRAPAPAPAAAPAPRTSAPTAAAVPCQPSSSWSAAALANPIGLHGPYATVDQAVLRDAASVIAYRSARANALEQEYGFLVVRDARQATGGYYTTPPVIGPIKQNAEDRPTFTIPDYQSSLNKGFGTCSDIKFFNVVATVHTHPNVLYPSNSFTADDFNQAIAMKKEFPSVWEKIVMINARDGKIRTFTPRASDTPIGSLMGNWYVSVVGALPYIDVNWALFAQRTQVIGEFY